jgi:hypothetical protein
MTLICAFSPEYTVAANSRKLRLSRIASCPSYPPRRGNLLQAMIPAPEHMVIVVEKAILGSASPAFPISSMEFRIFRMCLAPVVFNHDSCPRLCDAQQIVPMASAPDHLVVAFFL